MSADARILELKLQLPPAPKPLAVYKPLVLAGNMAYVSGHGPVKSDGGLILGRLGEDMDLEQGKAAARQVGLAILSTVRESLGSLDRVVRVINNMEEPITLEPPASSNPAFQSVLKTLKPGKEFELQISVIPPATAGTVQGIITVKTSSTNLPLINVTTMAIVPAAVVTTPSQVMLPSRPLTGPIKITLAIRNDGGEPIALSNPSVSVSNVAVKLSEVQAGQRYNLVLDFPAGFELKPGERGSLVVNTSDPQNPRITVPILQPPAAPKPKASPSVQR